MDRLSKYEDMQRDWTDQYVTVDASRPELRRFADIVGRVVTVNFNGKAVVDFQDGGWYDISPEFLTRVPAEEGKAKYKNVNSAQVIPAKGG